MATLGIVTCQILELEFAYLLANDTDVDKLTVLETGFSKGFVQSYQEIKGTKPEGIEDIRRYVPADTGRLEVVVHVLDLGLHTVINNLKMTVAEAVLEMGPCVDAIVMGYGLCGNALRHHDDLFKEAGVPVFMPVDDDHTVDDCVGLIIGGRENYIEEQYRCAGTFFMNAGFSRHWQDLLYKAHGVSYDEPISKRIMAAYERTLLLTTPVLAEKTMAAGIAPFNHVYELRTEVREGSLELLEKTWDRGKRQVS